MKIIKRPASEVAKEEAHGGSGSRKVYASPEHMMSSHFEMVTHGYLPAGNSFDWHEHEGIEEIMIVVKGRGEVHDEDGLYSYEPGDVFIYPANTQHMIHNPSSEEHEMIFIRVKT
ncbi:MAG: cupin domain-containing protein [Candidatus Saccharimonas sp.]|nr:cupin domain-containing protein [Candidatus Saccharimonas sp.]